MQATLAAALEFRHRDLVGSIIAGAAVAQSVESIDHHSKKNARATEQAVELALGKVEEQVTVHGLATLDPEEQDGRDGLSPMEANLNGLVKAPSL